MDRRKVTKSSGAIVADPCWVAGGMLDLFWGLMGEPGLERGAGLLLKPCSSIHTCFMRFDIDAVFLDREGRVLSVKRNLKPWRMPLPVWGAHSVLELAAGGAAGLGEGEVLCIS